MAISRGCVLRRSSMRVVSWNIHWGCGRDGRIRIHAIIDALRKLNPHVICLQEVAANRPEREACARAAIYQLEPELEPPFQLGFRPGTAVLCGDFNFAPNDEDYRELTAPPAPGALQLLDTWNLRHGDKPRAPTAGLHGYKWPDKPGCYDYFFVTDDLAPRVTEVSVQSETSASDH